MSTIVFQCIERLPVESQFMEPLTLRLRLASPSTTPQVQPHFGITSESECPEVDVWGFLKIPECPDGFGESLLSSYPPSDYSSFSPSWMSDKSLELCTENLGNETGCVEISDRSLFSSSSSSGHSPRSSESDQYENHPRRSVALANKEADQRSFPPPLTTIRGGNSIQFRSRRQEGWLVIEAVRAPPVYRSLQTNRSPGRLRLCFLDEPASASASDPMSLDCQEIPQEEELVDLELDGEPVDADCREGGADQENEKLGIRTGNMEMLARTGRSRCAREGSDAEGNLLDWGPRLVAAP
ncbi:hypothetical protein SAY86_027533 [Trapa natans]|uniref:FAF domain-containing protein n=1 Tax=Trapa natans TaxID=22666 RepID=A0AAN7QKT3_TRANT|nr:hypothetical protein SAY86_027533 [Trapa natans]